MIVDPNTVACQRKRSSLRQNHIFTDPKDFQDWLNRMKSKSLQWDSQVEEPGAHLGTGETTLKVKDAQAVIQPVDITDDIYLNKLAVVNKIEPTKEVLEEIVEMVEENEPNKELKDQNAMLVEAMPNEPEKPRRPSIKDEFTIARDLLKQFTEDELDPEVIEETMKNTLYNKVVGKLEKEEDDGYESN